MARQNRDFIAERIKLLLDSPKEKVAVATRQIPTPDSTGEQDISADEERIFPRKKTEASRAMPGHFDYFHFDPEEILCGSGRDQKIRVDWFYFQFEAETAKEIRIGNHGGRFGVATYLATETALDLCDIRHVVEMAMGEQEKLGG